MGRQKPTRSCFCGEDEWRKVYLSGDGAWAWSWACVACGRCETPSHSAISKADVYQAAMDRLRAENERLREEKEWHKRDATVMRKALRLACDDAWSDGPSAAQAYLDKAADVLDAALGGSQAKGSE